jgi:hypothetical protein
LKANLYDYIFFREKSGMQKEDKMLETFLTSSTVPIEIDDVYLILKTHLLIRNLWAFKRINENEKAFFKSHSLESLPSRAQFTSFSWRIHKNCLSLHFNFLIFFFFTLGSFFLIIEYFTLPLCFHPTLDDKMKS